MVVSPGAWPIGGKVQEIGEKRVIIKIPLQDTPYLIEAESDFQQLFLKIL